ncbi:MAG TPA: type VI secretion system contractile sheath large subunit, partial [Gemmataceae bacterium]|nr:type VI secretion system contractile sheath large subunit [Gemmataceae bacterium]
SPLARSSPSPNREYLPMAEQTQTAAAAATTTTEFDSAKWLDSALGRMKVTDDAAARQRGIAALNDFIKSALQPGQVVNKDVETNIKLWISAIDQKMTAQMNEILHHPSLQKLEGTWRGLHYLVKKTETGETLKLRVMNVTKDELRNDLERAVEFDMSETFKKVYEEEYGQLGGFPFGLLVADYEFDVRRSPDTKLLQNLSGVAAAAHAPLISAVSPKSFNMDRFSELSNPRDLAKIFTGPDYAAWQAFRDSEDSRYVALTCPRVLAREVYGEKFNPVAEFNFEENVDGTDHDKYLWMNAAWTYAANVTDAYAKYGWMARTRGVEGGGKVEGLPVHTFPTDDGDVAMKCPTEVAITERREQELEKLGFLSLIHCKGQPFAAFMSATSTQKPKKYDRDSATANAILSTKFNQLMCVSRFAHFLKVMVRNRVGSFMERADMERWLNRWINNYTLANPETAGDETKAQKPLAWAEIKVVDVPAQPGVYRAVAHLRPHFQLEALDISLRMVAKQLGK